MNKPYTLIVETDNYKVLDTKLTPQDLETETPQNWKTQLYIQQSVPGGYFNYTVIAKDNSYIQQAWEDAMLKVQTV